MTETMKAKYDLIVVGAGHAGLEAAFTAAHMGKQVLLLTLSLDHIALLPCNPSIGGPAKGHLVREIDALGGVMGEAADATDIQMRLLNTQKGPAVQALRAQVDKPRYGAYMRHRLQEEANITLLERVVEGLIIEAGAVQGVVDEYETAWQAPRVIVCTGTYLRGQIIIGDLIKNAGPGGQVSPQGLSRSIAEDAGLATMRFKTGTPPRVDGRTLDRELMAVQPEDAPDRRFSHWSEAANGLEKRPCYLTYTSADTHAIIRDNWHRSPMQTGLVTGAPPRYCPSIEDKIHRFSDKSRHQLFIEPEGLDTTLYYMQGFATSLPVDVQEQMVHSVPGLAHATVVRAGYAIEYDLIEPTQLYPTLECQSVKGLYFAGQMNGTSGYEEAAAQGLMAGINAVLSLEGKAPFVLRRHEAYIGVLIDDLITKGTREPYRMLTSRCEYRLLLRQDNAHLRLTPYGRRLGLIDDDKWAIFQADCDQIAAEKDRLKGVDVSPADADLASLLTDRGSTPLKQKITALALLKRPEIGYRDLVALGYGDGCLPARIWREVETAIKYEGYIAKQEDQVARLEKLENKQLPADFDYSRVTGLRKEACEKLSQIRPLTVGQASRISGVNPADITVLLVGLKKAARLQGGNYDR